MSLVADSTPLIALGRIKALHILRAFAGEVLVPPAVAREVFSVRLPKHARLSLRALPWLTLARPRRAPPFAFPPKLGAGECEAITLAYERELPLLTDDYDAGRFARGEGIPVIRTLALLLAAEEQRLVEDAEPLVDALVANGFRLSTEVLAAFRAQLRASRTRGRGTRAAA